MLFAYGYDLVYGPQTKPPDEFSGLLPSHVNGRLLAARIVPRENATAWKDFLTSIPGRPIVVVADGAKAIRNGVFSAFPGAPYQPSPEFVRCSWHLSNNLAKAVKKDIKRLNSYNGGRDAHATYINPEKHALVSGAGHAVASSTAWRQFRNDAYALFGLHPAFTDASPSATLKWLSAQDSFVLAQIARRHLRVGPAGTGPLEAHIVTFRQRLAGRAQSIRNPERTNRLLALMVAGVNTDADATEWADRIYQHLLEHSREAGSRQRAVTGIRL